MKIERVEVWNLRSLKEVDIPFNDYTCFVGPNSAGKSTALCALNIFFRQSENTGTNFQSLEFASESLMANCQLMRMRLSSTMLELENWLSLLKPNLVIQLIVLTLFIMENGLGLKTFENFLRNRV